MSKKSLAAIIVFSTLAVALLFGGFIWWVVKATGEPVKVIRAHLEAISQGDYARAHSYFSATLKQELSQEQFRAFVEKYSGVLKTRGTSFPSRKIANNVATIRGSLTGQQGRVSTVRYTLVRESGRWVIQGFRLGEPPEED